MNVMNRSSAQMIVLINFILFEKHSIGLSRYPFADLVNIELHTLL